MIDLSSILCCPDCQSSLSRKNDEFQCAGCRAVYPIERGIPRFVKPEANTDTFGFQWNRFRRTQMDSHTGMPLSAQRFWDYSGWKPEDLKGKLVLDAGCGAGRFAEVALDGGARVVAIDYSNAVEACQQNLDGRDIAVLQADVCRLPFRPESFDFIYCFGVLQHTPSPESSFQSLPPKLKRGGRLVVDVYPWLWRNLLWSKYWIRPVMKRIPQRHLFPIVEEMVKWLLPVSLAICRIPKLGRQLRYAIPVANHKPDWPLSDEQVREWAVLNTFDMMSPTHDHPQKIETIQRWFSKGFRDVRIFRQGFFVGRGVKD
jgi:SAM-dependent methyltransferase